MEKHTLFIDDETALCLANFLEALLNTQFIVDWSFNYNDPRNKPNNFNAPNYVNFWVETWNIPS